MNFEVKHIGRATLYLADCIEIMSNIDSVHSTICDPPYGVDLKSKKTKHGITEHDLGYLDTEENFRNTVLPRVAKAIEISKRAAFFCGVRRLQEYPAAMDIGGIFCPNGAGLSRWGFGCYHPVAFYGKRPRAGCWPTMKSISHPGGRATGESNIDHPCPKPLVFMEWLVELASNVDEVVFDPFMGSGTTGVACAKLNRKFIGVEIEPRYFEVACERIERASLESELVS